MVQLEWVDVDFVGFVFLPNLHPLTLMVKKLGSLCQDMKPGPQRVQSLAKLGSPVRTWNPVHFSVSGHETRSTGSLNSGKTWISMSGHETQPTGTPKTSKCRISVSGHETWSTGTRTPDKLRSPCQDMKPGPQGKFMYYYFNHGSDLGKIIRFLHEIECIEFECNEFVLVLVQIKRTHFEHSICISST